MFSKMLVVLSLVCLFSLPALAQTKATRKAHNVSTTICKVASVPKGMVIVGYKPNASCAGGMELTVKRPAESEIVCADSPVPEGYSVRGIEGTLACQLGDSNQVTNAMGIARGDAAPAALVSSNYSAPARQVNRSRSYQPERGEAEEHSENAGPSRDEIDLAIRRQTVLLGMQMQDVSRAWGAAHTSDSQTDKDGISYIWDYKRGRVCFRNGKAYKIILLKG